MKLCECVDWKAVHFSDGRVILRGDSYLYNLLDWERLVCDTEVEPLKIKGHYKVRDKDSFKSY